MIITGELPRAYVSTLHLPRAVFMGIFLTLSYHLYSALCAPTPCSMIPSWYAANMCQQDEGATQWYAHIRTHTVFYLQIQQYQIQMTRG